MLNELIQKRKSIRTYDANGAVTDEQIRELLEAAMLAPSACNSRPWEFIVVRNRDTLLQITKAHPFAQMLKQASAGIVVIADTALQEGISEGFFPQDCGAATQNILLQAAALGLGTCWCGVYPKEDKVAAFKRLFSLPEKKIPFCVIAVGVPKEPWGSRGVYEESKVTWIR